MSRRNPADLEVYLKMVKSKNASRFGKRDIAKDIKSIRLMNQLSIIRDSEEEAHPLGLVNQRVGKYEKSAGKPPRRVLKRLKNEW